LPQGQAPNGGEIEKLICRPDSHIARDMLRRAILDRDHPRALHRLGIAMHVYADTFAHQGFVGAMSVANQTKSLTSGDSALDTQIKESTKKELFGSITGNFKNFYQVLVKTIGIIWHERRWPGEFFTSFLDKTPVGHASADVYPDQPYLKWQYIDFKNQMIQRDNPSIFMEAMDKMIRAMQAWRAGDFTMNLEDQSGLSEVNRGVIEHLFRESVQIDGEERRQDWLSAIAQGEFSFGSEIPNYVGKGPGSWKEAALGTTKVTDSGFERFPYTNTFLTSDWKLFHDALQVHRSDIVHDILPLYGICAA